MSKLFTQIVTGLLVLTILGYVGYFIVKNPPAERGTPDHPLRVDTQEAVRKLPQGVPIEKMNTFDQAYTLDYGAGLGDQATLTFDSPKTVSENYGRYAEFFTKNGWTVVNSYKTPATGVLYGVKDNLTLSVVISTTGIVPPTQSKVTLSFLKK